MNGTLHLAVPVRVDGWLRRTRSRAPLAATMLLLCSFAGPARPLEAAPADPDSIWAEARRLSDAKEFDAALALLGDALATRPDDTRLAWLRAGVVGWSGRHADAVLLYEELVAAHPELADAVASDLASERLAAGDHARALADLEAHLAEHPDDLDARRDRALALTYLERFDEAEAAYRQILADHPDDAEARLGLARAVNWRGDHRRAASLYEDMAAGGMDDVEVYNGLAYAHYWAGRADLARAPLDHALALQPGNATSMELADRLAWDRSPWASADYEASEDSDELEVRTATLRMVQPVSPRDVLSGIWRRQATGGPPQSFDLAAVGAGYQRVWSHVWSSDLTLEYQYDGAGTTEHLLGEANVVIRPSDRLRLDAGAAQEQVLAGGALALDIRMWTATLGADWHPAPRWLLSGAVLRHWYSDDNTALRTRARAEYVLSRRSGLEVTGKFLFEQLAAADNPGHGYYAPEGYFEAAPALEVAYSATSGWSVGAEGRMGVQAENGSPAELLLGLSARAEAPIGRYLAVGVRVEVSDSNLSAASGYSRNALGAYLRGRF